MGARALSDFCFLQPQFSAMLKARELRRLGHSLADRRLPASFSLVNADATKQGRGQLIEFAFDYLHVRLWT